MGSQETHQTMLRLTGSEIYKCNRGLWNTYENMLQLNCIIRILFLKRFIFSVSPLLEFEYCGYILCLGLCL